MQVYSSSSLSNTTRTRKPLTFYSRVYTRICVAIGIYPFEVRKQNYNNILCYNIIIYSLHYSTMYTRGIIHIIVQLTSIVNQYILLFYTQQCWCGGEEGLCNRHRMYTNDAMSNRDRSRIRRIDKHRKLRSRAGGE